VAELLARGVTVGLGCDSMAAGDTLDMFRAMRQVATSLEDAPPEKALEMATIDGARALGWDAEIGSLEPGKRADVIVVDAPRTNRVLSHDLSGADVETTIVDGRVLMENRRLSTIDGIRVLAEARRITERIARQLPHETLRPRWPVL
jgi:cytosine/adenosine deaminase-related metal-dependent hydrolase